MLSLFLTSDTLPPGKLVSIDLANKSVVDNLKKNPLSIKEGVEYKFRPPSPAPSPHSHRPASASRSR